MKSVIKPWNDGGSLSVAYEGDGDGFAVFSSDSYEGIDREMEVNFVGGGASLTRKVRQEGTRQPIRLAGGGIFRLANGGRFGVLKEGGVVPPTPPTPDDTYTRLTYIECNGQQYIDLGYIVKEDDVIEANFILTKIANADTFLFGTIDANAGLWFEFYSKTAYVRFGKSASKSISSSSGNYSVKLQKGKVTLGTTETSLEYEQMPVNTINIFAGRGSDGAAYSRGNYRCTKFRISDSNGLVMDLIPVKRDSDGVIGMLDLVSGTFYTSAEEPFIGGSEIRITDGYEVLDYTTFAKDRLYDLGIIKNTYELEVLFQRSEKSATPYLYGCITSPHTATVSAYLSSGGAWRFGSSYKGLSTNNTFINRVIISNGSTNFNFTAGTFTKSTFTTPDTLVLGGYRAASGALTKNYQGKVFYFRIREGDTLLLDWYPCKRLSDGVEGFWDCVTQTFVEPL